MAIAPKVSLQGHSWTSRLAFVDYRVESRHGNSLRNEIIVQIASGYGLCREQGLTRPFFWATIALISLLSIIWA
jgi:hypothetical protein